MTKSIRLNDATPADWDRLRKETPAIEKQKTGLEHWETKVAIDPVNSPSHYNSGKVEAIEAIEASMEPEAFKGYLKGNTLKYIWRMSYKGKSVEDCKKAQWYLNKMIAVLEAEG